MLLIDVLRVPSAGTDAIRSPTDAVPEGSVRPMTLEIPFGASLYAGPRSLRAPDQLILSISRADEAANVGFDAFASRNGLRDLGADRACSEILAK
jgi:hypothetical protein